MKNVLHDNDSKWLKNPYAVPLGRSFNTFQDAVKHSAEADKVNQSGEGKAAIDLIIDKMPNSLVRKNTQDTTVGGNDAINCYWQFNRDDDIVHPLTSNGNSKGKHDLDGMGRVYFEMYQRNQQILYLAAGVPRYSGLKDFYTDAADSQTADYMRTGNTITLKSVLATLGNLIGTGVKLAIAIPFLPMIGAAWAAQKISTIQDVPITGYYSFSPTPVLYYRLVNVILAHLAVGMELYPNADAEVEKLPANGIPKILRDGPDIFRIMFRKYQQQTGLKVGTDDLVGDQKQDNNGGRAFTDILGNIRYAATGGTDYVGFRIEKSTDSSESFSSSSGESSLAGKLNGKASEMASKKFDLAGGKIGNAMLDGVKDMITGTLSGVASSVGADGLTEVLSGNGYFNIPEVWKSSSFSKSYNFTIELRSRYGDPVSIYQSIYIPLAMLLAMSLPRSIGGSMYTSPFVVQAYCKGMFAVPLGLIESLQIKRGDAEFGWTEGKLPTRVNVSMTIKDLSPAMFVGLEGSGLAAVADSFKRNTSFHEYMSTLSGLGLADRTFGGRSLKRKAAAALMINKNTLGNPYYWSSSVGHSNITRLFSNLLPNWYTPNN